MTDTQNKRAVIIEAFVLMIVLQGILELLEWLIAPSVPATRFASQMLSCALMCLLTVAVIIYARVRKQKLSVFPKAFSKFYIIATCITVLLLIVNPSNFSVGFAAVKSTVYFSIVTRFMRSCCSGAISEQIRESDGQKVCRLHMEHLPVCSLAYRLYGAAYHRGQLVCRA